MTFSADGALAPLPAGVAPQPANASAWLRIPLRDAAGRRFPSARFVLPGRGVFVARAQFAAADLDSRFLLYAQPGNERTN